MTASMSRRIGRCLGKDAQLLSVPSIMVEHHGGFDVRGVTSAEAMSMNRLEMFSFVHVVPVLMDSEIHQRLLYLGATALKEEVFPECRLLCSNRFFGFPSTLTVSSSPSCLGLVPVAIGTKGSDRERTPVRHNTLALGLRSSPRQLYRKCTNAHASEHFKVDGENVAYKSWTESLPRSPNGCPIGTYSRHWSRACSHSLGTQSKGTFRVVDVGTYVVGLSRLRDDFNSNLPSVSGKLLESVSRVRAWVCGPSSCFEVTFGGVETYSREEVNSGGGEFDGNAIFSVTCPYGSSVSTCSEPTFSFVAVVRVAISLA